MFRLFVYGTLMRGCINHDFCRRDLRDVREASVRGRLYATDAYPMLEVPSGEILAEATGNPRADAVRQSRLQVTSGSAVNRDKIAGWGTVHGEIMTFPAPQNCVPAIDRLEGFRPGGRSLYHRVLVPARVSGREEPAWVYAAVHVEPWLKRIKSGRWREACRNRGACRCAVRHRAPARP